MRFWRLCLWLIVLPAVAAEPAPVVHLLGGYEWHLDAAAFRHLGPDAYKSLLSIASDKSRTNLIRGRALAALTLYPNEAVLKYMQGGVAESDNRIRRRRMVDALCATFAASRASLVEDTVTPLLAAEDPHLRVSAAKCLGRVGGPKAKAALQNYRANVAAPWEVREAGISQTGAP